MGFELFWSHTSFPKVMAENAFKRHQAVFPAVFTSFFAVEQSIQVDHRL